jgi:hypothetical protein
LTKDEWYAARRRWEGATADGFGWLATEIQAALGVEISRQAVSKMASKCAWTKGKVLDRPLIAVAQPEQPAQPQPVEAQPDAQPGRRAKLEPTAVIVPPPHARKKSTETGLSREEEQFATALALNEDQSKAYRAAFSKSAKLAESTISTYASLLAAEPRIQARVQALLAHAARENEADVAMVLKEYLTRMRADPRELTALHVAPCRYCWGTNHLFQYTDGELEDKRAEHEEKRLARQEAGRPDIGPFREKGGGGYSVLKEPNPVCPSCGGAGMSRVVLKDSRKYSAAALALFEGVKQTKEGIEVKTTARADMLAQVARHVGFFEADKDEAPTFVFDMRELGERFAEKMGAARARMQAALAERVHIGNGAED